jgi:hypothetical protein
MPEAENFIKLKYLFSSQFFRFNGSTMAAAGLQ